MKAVLKVVSKEGFHLESHGDWIDLVTNQNIALKGPTAEQLHRYKEVKERTVEFSNGFVDLVGAIILPAGYEAIVAPRSSLFKKYAVTFANSIGVIDNAYCGADDIWKAHLIAFKTVVIPKGTRIAQFRIQLSQYATVWQKIKWLFTSGIDIQYVSAFEVAANKNRGGFGSTDK